MISSLDSNETGGTANPSPACQLDPYPLKRIAGYDLEFCDHPLEITWMQDSTHARTRQFIETGHWVLATGY